MSVLHCRETPGLDHLDIGLYEKHGLMTLRPMTPEERREALRPWDGNKLAGAVEPCPRQHTPLVTHGVNKIVEIPGTQAERDRAYLDAVDDSDWERAYQIAHRPVPPDSTVEERSNWGARRYRTRVEANKPEIRKHEVDICPVSGKKVSKTYEEWRAYYEKERRKRDHYRPSPILQKVAMFSIAALILPFALLGSSMKGED